MGGKQYKWKGTSVTLIVPDDILEWIDERAVANYQTRSDYIRRLLVQAKRQSEATRTYVGEA